MNQDKDQLFQQGVIARRDGDSEKIARCYRMVLTSDSKSSGVNHKQSITAVLAEKAECAKEVLVNGRH